ncbi:hypothetical protein PQR67_12045 [Paraburkholderia fungorum]|uniref:hypothetical protein n=1 Tax=Paraburkholderia fungorum TaxID=134537 RepID=UPI0038BCF6E5
MSAQSRPQKVVALFCEETFGKRLSPSLPMMTLKTHTEFCQEEKMSFWADISSYIGQTTFGVKLHGKLALPASDGGWRGGLTMATYKLGSDYYLSDDHQFNPIETESVYFLSWSVDGVTKVSYETLKDFNYFLTSEFSGCRFVVTDYGVAHVAWSAGGHRASGIGSQDLRDTSERKELGYDTFGKPKYRRKLSFTSSAAPLDNELTTAGTDNSSQHYEGGNRAMVFGYRVQGGWAFKVLRYDGNTGSGTGTWSNFCCTWTV